MTAKYDDNMRGVLFIQDKGDNPKRPALKGNFEIEGQKYDLICWDQVSRKGTKYYSVKIEKPQEPSSEVQPEPLSDVPY